jgi:hypothetical protein
MHALGSEHQSRCGRTRVAHATGRDDRQVDPFGDQGQQHHRVGGFVRGLQTSDDVNDRHARIVQPGGEQRRIAGGGEHVPHAGLG